MVDIIIITHAILKMHIVIDGCKNIFFCNVLRDQVMEISLDHPFHLIHISCGLFDDTCKYRVINLLCHSNLCRINIDNRLKIYHQI